VPFSGGELSEKGFPRGWDADAEDQASQRVFRMTQLLEAMVFRPFSWDRFNSLNLKYAFHGGYIDTGAEWLRIKDSAEIGGSFVTLVNGATNFIERTDAGNVVVNQSAFTYDLHIPMAIIDARNGKFVPSTYIDSRPEIGGAPSTGGGGQITFSQIIGQILDAQVPLSAVAQHQFELLLSFTQMIDQILDSQVPESAVTQHEAALAISFAQMTDQIFDDQVPLSAVLQFCEEIDSCLGAFIPGWGGNLTDLVGFLLSRDTPPEATPEEIEDIDAALGSNIPGWEGLLTDLVGWLIARDRKVTFKDNEIFITISPAFETVADLLEFLLARATQLPPPHVQIASNFQFC
jgi:hypothetical protein